MYPPSPATVPSARTKVRRAPRRARYERDVIEAILDEALVAHLGFVHDGQPYVIPTLHARIGATLYIHGSTASRAIRTLGAGAPACLTVTLLDGLVLARSAFHHSVNYRSVVVLGMARPVGGAAERREALHAFTERLVPGRWEEVRAPNKKELRGTQVLAMDLAEASAKIRSGPPVEEPEDLSRATWSGVIPLRLAAGQPQPAPELTPGIQPSAVVAGWAMRLRL
jgi:nitroimidazol reductase NimA-like FMN-containing flavoprotein (pyridoxamine 5'-phosphate oxidase superfamily)